MSNTTRKPGRPLGSKSSTATVTAPLPRCIKCGATEFATVKKISEQQIRGHTTDGQPYTSIVRRRVRCTACGQHQVHVTRPFSPKRWAASN